MRRLASGAVAILLLASLAGRPVAIHAENAPTEYQVKSAFIYNFVKFVDWPREAFARDDSPFIIGILGTDVFGGELERIVGPKSINQRRLKIEHLQPGDDLRHCHVLFVAPSEEKKLNQIFPPLKDRPVLTIGETPNFARAGGVIGFIIEDGKVRFEINVDAARRSHLFIQSALLNLARIRHDGP